MASGPPWLVSIVDLAAYGPLSWVLLDECVVHELHKR